MRTKQETDANSERVQIEERTGAKSEQVARRSQIGEASVLKTYVSETIW
jgi:hypothetical protein